MNKRKGLYKISLSDQKTTLNLKNELNSEQSM